MPDKPLVSNDHTSKIKDYVDQMPSLSSTVTKVLEVCNQPDTSPNDLNRVISLDPVLTGQVLKLINSAYYTLSNQVTSLTRAIIMLGLNTVKNLALSTAILGSLAGEKSQCLVMDSFWSHSLGVGVTAKALAAHKGIPASMLEEYFVAGLMHDLGKIPLSNCFAEDYRKALELAWLQRCSLQRAEKMIFGFDHCVAGKLIAEKWQLTGPITDTMVHHHDMDISGESRDLVVTVALANLYANLFDIGTAGDMNLEISDVGGVLDASEIEWQDLSTLNDKIQEEIDKAQVFLQIAGEGRA